MKSVVIKDLKFGDRIYKQYPDGIATFVVYETYQKDGVWWVDTSWDDYEYHLSEADEKDLWRK